jgi:ectoine hydroxylase-related dioxygenase (phytanoyl-CoA dioxygenase family)
MGQPQLDPGSEGFVWHDHVVSGSVLTESHLRKFDTDGFCVIEHALTAKLLRTVEREVDRLESERNEWLRRQSGRRWWISRADVIDFAPNLVRESDLLRNFSRSSPLTEICLDLVGTDVRLYFDQAVYKHPGPSDKSLPWHQDNGYNFKRPEAYITIWIPLQDVDSDNGCLWIVPSIHRLGTLRHRQSPEGFIVCEVDEADAVPVPVAAGDLVVFSSLTPHATGTNHATQVRKAYLLSYVADGTCLRDGSPCNAPETQYLVLQRARATSA